MCVKQDNSSNGLFCCLEIAVSFTDKSIKVSVFLDVCVIDASVSAHLFRLLFRWCRFYAEREEMEDDDQGNREKVIHQV